MRCGASFSLSSDSTCGLGGGRDNARASPSGRWRATEDFTQTHLLRKGSAAVDAGAGAGCPRRRIDEVWAGPREPHAARGAGEMRAVDFQVKIYLPAAIR